MNKLVIRNENHTLGSLYQQYLLMEPDILFAGYTMCQNDKDVEIAYQFNGTKDISVVTKKILDDLDNLKKIFIEKN